MAPPLFRLPFEPVDVYLADRYGDLVVPACPNRWYGYPAVDVGDADVVEIDRRGRPLVCRYCGSQAAARLVGPVPGNRSSSGAVSDRTIDRWRSTGVSVWLADRIATALGLPPDDRQLWGLSWADAVDSTIDRWIRSGPRRPVPPPPDEVRYPSKPRRKTVAA